MESISAYIYVTEIADRKHRALHSCTWTFGIILGVMQATIFGTILTSALSDESMHAWGWRIPWISSSTPIRYRPRLVKPDIRSDNSKRRAEYRRLKTTWNTICVVKETCVGYNFRRRNMLGSRAASWMPLRQSVLRLRVQGTYKPMRLVAVSRSNSRNN